MRFNEIIGNEEAKDILIKTIKSKNILNSYMFVGEEGIGKKLIAVEFARMILCESEDCENDDSCNSCIKFNSNNHPDYFFIEKLSDKNSIIIDQIREVIDNVYQKPIESNRKVFIINDCELMTEEAQNAFLKTLEEPPSYTTIILVTSREDMLLNTVVSRCTKIQFNELNDAEMLKYVELNNNINQKTKELIEYANGSIGKLNYIQNNLELFEQIENNIHRIVNGKVKSLITCIKENSILYSCKEEISSVLDFIIMVLFKEMKNNYALSIKVEETIRYIEFTKTKFKSNCNFEMTIDDMLFKIWEEFNEKYSRS